MVGKVIRDYMESGAKKLTVPGFGTFMRRDGDNARGGEIIFVDLLRGDDKTLSEMVEDRGRYSELEAMALIDRFIFETKHAIERYGSAAIEGFGTLTLDHKGVYQFKYSPRVHPVKEHAVQEQLFAEKTEAPPKPVQPAPSPAPRVSAQHSAHRPAAAPAGKQPLRSTPERTQQRPPAGKPGHRPHGKKHSKTDTTLIVAIVAAVIAVIVMIFAFSAGNMPFLSK